MPVELGGQVRQRETRIGDRDPRHVEVPPAARSDTIAAAPAAIACCANSAPSIFRPRSATNTVPGVTRRESCVTPVQVCCNAACPFESSRSSNGTCGSAREATVDRHGASALPTRSTG